MAKGDNYAQSMRKTNTAPYPSSGYSMPATATSNRKFPSRNSTRKLNRSTRGGKAR